MSITIEALVQVSLLVLLLLCIIAVLKIIVFISSTNKDAKKILFETANLLENTAVLTKDVQETVKKVRKFSLLRFKK